MKLSRIWIGLGVASGLVSVWGFTDLRSVLVAATGQTASSATKRTCPNCFKQLPLGAKFCDKCGKKLNEIGLRKLTQSTYYVGEPDYSADGSAVVFEAQVSGVTGKGLEIFLLDSNLSKITKLTSNENRDGYPSWSPDGRKIVFASDRTGNGDIYVMNRDGSGVTRVTTSEGTDERPSWSPDGSTIVFSSYRDGNWEIYTCKVDGSDVKRLTTSPMRETNARYSPDGSKIIYSCGLPSNDDEHDSLELNCVCQIASGGGDYKILLRSIGRDYDAEFSPDGRKIAFCSSREGDFDIYVADASGANAKRVTYVKGLDESPTWTSDSKRLVFESGRDSDHHDLYLVDIP